MSLRSTLHSLRLPSRVHALPAEGLFLEFQFFFKNGKAYAVEEEDGYKFVKRYNFEIQEYKDNKWIRKK